jgi:hypothetical protein
MTRTPVPTPFVNGCDRTIPEALRFLAANPRPAGGQERFNAEHLLMLACELEASARPIPTPRAPRSLVTRAMVVAVNDRLILQGIVREAQDRLTIRTRRRERP